MWEVVHMVRLNITMPEGLAEQLKTISNKSRFIAQALREKFQRERKKKLIAELTEGYKAMSSEDQGLLDDWDNVTVEDGWS